MASADDLSWLPLSALSVKVSGIPKKSESLQEHPNPSLNLKYCHMPNLSTNMLVYVYMLILTQFYG